jgi:hypothetical protein
MRVTHFAVLCRNRPCSLVIRLGAAPWECVVELPRCQTIEESFCMGLRSRFFLPSPRCIQRKKVSSDHQYQHGIRGRGLEREPQDFSLAMSKSRPLVRRWIGRGCFALPSSDEGWPWSYTTLIPTRGGAYVSRVHCNHGADGRWRNVGGRADRARREEASCDERREGSRPDNPDQSMRQTGEWTCCLRTRTP